MIAKKPDRLRSDSFPRILAVLQPDVQIRAIGFWIDFVMVDRPHFNAVA